MAHKLTTSLLSLLTFAALGLGTLACDLEPVEEPVDGELLAQPGADALELDAIAPPADPSDPYAEAEYLAAEAKAAGVDAALYICEYGQTDELLEACNRRGAVEELEVAAPLSESHGSCIQDNACGRQDMA